MPAQWRLGDVGFEVWCRRAEQRVKACDEHRPWSVVCLTWQPSRDERAMPARPRPRALGVGQLCVWGWATSVVRLGLGNLEGLTTVTASCCTSPLGSPPCAVAQHSCCVWPRSKHATSSISGCHAASIIRRVDACTVVGYVQGPLHAMPCGAWRPWYLLIDCADRLARHFKGLPALQMLFQQQPFDLPFPHPHARRGPHGQHSDCPTS